MRVGLVMRGTAGGWTFAWGGSMKSSRRTSRQLLQAAEMRLNSAKTQSEAARTPVLGGRSVSRLERVLRLLKLTSLAMSAWMRSGETFWRAAATAGSAGAGAMGCWAGAAREARRQAAARGAGGGGGIGGLSSVLSGG